MPETPHIKRFEKYLPNWEYRHLGGSTEPSREDIDFAIISMMDSLAEHIERFEARLSTIEYNLNMVPPDPTQDGNHTL